MKKLIAMSLIAAALSPLTGMASNLEYKNLTVSDIYVGQSEQKSSFIDVAFVDENGNQIMNQCGNKSSKWFTTLNTNNAAYTTVLALSFQNKTPLDLATKGDTKDNEICYASPSSTNLAFIDHIKSSRG